MSITAKDIQRVLLININETHNLCMAENIVPPGYYEMDVMKITKAKFIYEYEVKISKADLLADFRNKADKHELMQNKTASKKAGRWRVLRVPNYFYLCGPPSIFENVEIPKNYGVIHISEDGSNYVTIHKRPRRLHGVKASDDTLMNIMMKLSTRLYYAKYARKR